MKPECTHDDSRVCQEGEAYDPNRHCRLCWLWDHDAAYHRAWGGPGLRTAAGPCRHKGAEARRVECPTCRGKVELKVFACALHGECTAAKPMPGLACCASCADYDRDSYRLVAPRGTADAPVRWEGRCPMKPWHYRVTATIPHLDTPEPLAVVVELLRLQTERPYILVIDTGSPPAVCAELERLRADDLEIHYLKGHAWIHSSAPVSAAQDVAMALCRSEHLYCTHTDVFPRRRDLLAWLVGRTGPESPVVGYGMSDRSWASDLWQQCIGHQCLMLHMPTIRQAGATWNMEHAFKLAGWTGRNAVGWPDTETGFSLDLLRRGLKPTLLGREQNFIRFVDTNIDHARTFTGAKIYLDEGAQAQTKQWMGQALADARERIRQWKEGR